jgi:hypothetical protein
LEINTAKNQKDEKLYREEQDLKETVEIYNLRKELLEKIDLLQQREK